MKEQIFACIYTCTNYSNGKSYVGQTVNCNQRWRDHFRMLKGDDEVDFHRDLTEHWQDFIYGMVLDSECGYKNASQIFSILDCKFFDAPESPEEEQAIVDWLNANEIKWIAKLDTCTPAGYNSTAGGGRKRLFQTKSTKEAKRQKSLEYYANETEEQRKHRIEAQRIANNGYEISDDTKKKLSEAQKGIRKPKFWWYNDRNGDYFYAAAQGIGHLPYCHKLGAYNDEKECPFIYRPS